VLELLHGIYSNVNDEKKEGFVDYLIGYMNFKSTKNTVLQLTEFLTKKTPVVEENRAISKLPTAAAAAGGGRKR
jgi:hypothetical protein